MVKDRRPSSVIKACVYTNLAVQESKLRWAAHSALLTPWWLLVKERERIPFFLAEDPAFCILLPVDLISSVQPIYFYEGIRPPVKNKSNHCNIFTGYWPVPSSWPLRENVTILTLRSVIWIPHWFGFDIFHALYNMKLIIICVPVTDVIWYSSLKENTSTGPKNR